MCAQKSWKRGCDPPSKQGTQLLFFSPRKSLVVAMAINMPVTQQAFWHHTHEMGFYSHSLRKAKPAKVYLRCFMREKKAFEMI